MEIKIQCHNCGDTLEIVEEYTSWGNIIITIEPCKCVLEDKMYYIRATGDNQFAGGTNKWLRIRNFVKFKDSYEIAVEIRGNTIYVNVSEKHNKYIEFAEGWPGLMPVSLRTVINHYYKEN